ncbi:hypothetical protein Tco_1009431 [Tanacetum coccineum]
MTTLADKSLLSGGDNKPPMLEKHLYDSWKSRMELYMLNRPHGRVILASVEKGPLVWPTVTVDGVTRPKDYTELTPAETIQADCDIKAINIILQGLLTEIYALKGESLHEYYLKFTLLLNDMNIYNMPLEQFQVNTKFLNTLPAEWSKFVTDVKLVKDLHTTNIDQIHAHLEQHERHENEVRLINERNSDPLALDASHQMTQSPYQSHQHSYPNSQHQQFASPYQHSHEYSPTVNHQFEFSQLDSGLTILVFKRGDDPIDAINHVMSLLSAVVTSCFSTTNNLLRNSSNPRQQATINDRRVTVQPIQGRQISYAAGTTRTFTPAASGSNSGKQRIVTCYNYKGEGHMAQQCTKLKRQRNAAWYREKAMLAEAQDAGQILDEEQLAFLADPGVPASQAIQASTIIPHNAAFQTEDLDTYDSDCDDLATAQAVLMANISSYGSNVISEVPNPEQYLNDIEDQSVHAMQDFEQSPDMDFSDNEIHSDSNIIPYSQYLQETQQTNVQDTDLQAQQDSITLSVIEKLFEQTVNHEHNWEKTNKEQCNESLTSELERYKERVKSFEQRLNIDLSSHEKMIDS